MRLISTLLAFATLISAGIAAPTAANASGYHVEYSFGGGGDAAFPQAALMSFRGQLYGTTAGGGANAWGAVYSLDPTTGAETVVYSFKRDGDGIFPLAGLTNVGGKLYGTTSYDGANSGGSTNCGSVGCGTVFSADPTTGVETVVYSFEGDSDGFYPYASLIKVGGLLYGTTNYGGSQNFSIESGTIFSIDPSTGAEKVVYAFKGGSDGANPSSNLIDVGGLLYGTTVGGGSANCSPNCGTVFSVDPATGAERVLYVFKGGVDGQVPAAGLIKVDGLLYGTTIAGGGSLNCSGGCGTIFSLDPVSGVETILHAFKGGSDGALPFGNLIKAGKTLYGTTESGGRTHGTVFSLNLITGVETVLHAFHGAADGRGPEAGLFNWGRKLYGTTYFGGSNGRGTVFAISP